jgi:uncharacterized protein
MSVFTIVGLILLGLLAGFLSSMVGIGGGIVIVPTLVMGFGLSQHTAQGTTLAMLSLPVALIGAINYYKQGAVNWQFALIICIGFVVGSYFGSKIALEISEKLVKRFFAILLVLVAIKMFWDSK